MLRHLVMVLDRCTKINEDVHLLISLASGLQFYGRSQLLIHNSMDSVAYRRHPFLDICQRWDHL